MPRLPLSFGLRTVPASKVNDMVYSLTTWNRSGGIMACSVAPPVHPGIADRDLKELSIAHFHLDDPDRMARYAAAIRNADDATVELARMQLLHVTKEVVEHLDQMRFRHPIAIHGADDVGPAIRGAVEGIAADTADLLDRADQSPRSTSTLRHLAGALQTLAEASLFAARLRDANPDDASAQALASDAAGHLERALDASDRFRDTVGSRYAEVLKHLPFSANIRIEAESRLAAQAGIDASLLTPDHLDRTQGDCGDRNSLWVASQEKLRAAAIAKGRHHVLAPGKAAVLRTKVADIVEAYDAVFNQPGFVALLRQGATLSRWKGLNGIGDAHDGAIESDIRESHRRSKNSLNPREDAELAKALERLPKDRERWRSEGKAYLAAGMLLDHLVDGALAGLVEEARPLVVLRTDPATGAVVGSIRLDEAAPVIVIYRDKTLTGHPGAVLAVALPPEMVADGLPSVESIKGETWLGGAYKGTNYQGFEDAMACLAGGDVHSQQFFFGGPVSVLDETGHAWVPPGPAAPTHAPAP